MKPLFKKLSLNVLRFLPFTALISLMAFLSDETQALPMFLLALLLVFIGVVLFELGAKASTAKVASNISKAMIKKQCLALVIILGLLLGVLITLSEPNTWIISNFLKPFIREQIFVISVSIGIGITLMLALLRIVFRISIKSVFIVLYLATLMIAFITSIRNPKMVLLAFDSGAVIPGLILIPFLIGLSVGIGKLRSDKRAISDAFGMVGVVTLGPILSLLIIGLFYQIDTISRTPLSMIEYLRYYLLLMAVVLVPVMIVYTLFSYKILKTDKRQCIKTVIAFLYTYVGIVLLLTGINGGMMGFARLLGSKIKIEWLWLFMVGLGLSAILIEPSIRVLISHVLDITAGAINKRFVYLSLILSMILALLLIAIRVMFDLSLWWILIPGYIISITLSLFSKDVFLSIAFDAGGATSG